MQDSTKAHSIGSIELEAELRHRALLNAGLVEDTDDQIGLVFPLPADAQIVRVIRGYDTRKTSNQRVRCSACKQHQLHNRGFRVQLDNNDEARIGFDCGEHHFGQGAWKAAVSDYERRAENAHFISRIAPALRSIELVMPKLKEWHKRTNIFGKWIVEFQSEVPELFGALRSEAKLRDGRLERQRKIRRSKTDRLGKGDQETAYETVNIGRIPFPGMFLGSSPNHGLNAATNSFGLAVALLKNKQDTVSLAKAFRHIRDARQQLREAGEVHRRVLDNLDLGWLTPLCDWANREESLNAEYRVGVSGLIHDERQVEERFEFISRSSLGLPSVDAIDGAWLE